MWSLHTLTRHASFPFYRIQHLELWMAPRFIPSLPVFMQSSNIISQPLLLFLYQQQLQFDSLIPHCCLSGSSFFIFIDLRAVTAEQHAANTSLAIWRRGTGIQTDPSEQKSRMMILRHQEQDQDSLRSKKQVKKEWRESKW